MDQFLNEHTDDEIAVITYQISGTDTVPGGANRYYLYDPEGTPTVAGDGLVDIWPCGIANLRTHYNSRSTVPSPLTISVTEDAYGVFTAHITASSAVSGRVMMVAYEDLIHGSQRYRRWARQLLTPYNGEVFSIGASETKDVTKTITVSSSWDYASMGVVAWVYIDSGANWTTHESVQAATAQTGQPATPTQKPSATPTEPPQPTHTPIPTFTPDAPTATPQFTCTPDPTATPGNLTYDLTMSDTELTAGDLFLLERLIEHPEPSDLEVDEYIILDIQGYYYFWPDWTTDVSKSTWTMEASRDYDDVILSFTWPDIVTTLTEIRFWGGLVESGTMSLIAYDMVEWSAY